MSKERASIAHLILPTLLIAVSYYLSASFGQILAIPPGNITIVWPPSGLALGLVLVMGLRAIPGVFLGAVISNLNPSGDELAAASIAFGVIVGIGSSLQPVVGRMLYRRFDVGPAPLANARSVLRFIPAALLMTLVSSTIGTLALYFTDTLASGAARTFVTWWVGDAFGVLVFAPLVLLLFRQAFDTHRSRFLGLSIIIAGVSTIIMTLAIVMHYRVYFEAQTARLSEQAVNQARYLENLSEDRFAHGANIGDFEFDITEHFRLWDGDAANGRMFVLGSREGDAVRYLQRAGSNADRVPDLLPLASNLGEPMRRALQGEGGSMIGLDSTGRSVLAAYQPVPSLERGLVVQQELSIIRRPFILSAAALVVVTLILVASAMHWIRQLSAPMLAHLERKSEELQQLVAAQTQELRQSEQRFRSLLDSAPEAMVIINADGKMLLTNRKLAQITGYSVEELAGANVDMLVPAASRARHQAHRNRYYVKPEARKLDERAGLLCLRKDGTEFPVDISLNPIETAQGTIIAASIRDVTEQRKYEDALVESQARMSLALESGDMEAYELDVETGRMQSDGFLYRKYGYSMPPENAEAWMNASWLAIVHPDDSARLKEHIGRVMRSGEDRLTQQYRVMAKDGSTRWIEANSNVTSRDAQGLPRRIVGLRRDITRLKESELELNSKLLELEEFNKLAVGRELRMIELKQEINRLLAQQGKPEPYEIVP
jgi:PAS domain S-box-containing protein